MMDFYTGWIELMKCSEDVQSQNAMHGSGLMILCMWLLIQKMSSELWATDNTRT